MNQQYEHYALNPGLLVGLLPHEPNNTEAALSKDFHDFISLRCDIFAFQSFQPPGFHDSSMAKVLILLLHQCPASLVFLKWCRRDVFVQSCFKLSVTKRSKCQSTSGCLVVVAFEEHFCCGSFFNRHDSYSKISNELWHHKRSALLGSGAGVAGFSTSAIGLRTFSLEPASVVVCCKAIFLFSEE